MEKKVSSTGIYETTYSGDVFVGKLSTPTKIGLTDQTKVDLLKYLKGSDQFHKLVCDITGVERANGKLLAEDNELCRRENDRLKQSYDNVCNKIKEIEKNRNNLSDNYDRLIEDYSCLITRYNNQKKYIAKYIEENKRLIDKVEKLDKVSKQYRELIKAINDKAMKLFNINGPV